MHFSNQCYTCGRKNLKDWCSKKPRFNCAQLAFLETCCIIGEEGLSLQVGHLLVRKWVCRSFWSIGYGKQNTTSLLKIPTSQWLYPINTLHGICDVSPQVAFRVADLYVETILVGPRKSKGWVEIEEVEEESISERFYSSHFFFFFSCG